MSFFNFSGLRLAVGFIAACLIATPKVASGQSFVVIVNAQSGVKALSAKAISDIFLKRTRDLGGAAAQPVDLSESNPARQDFSKTVLGRPAPAVVSYWRQQVFAGREVPPPEKSAVADVVEMVAGSAGGIAYVPAGTALPASVKKIDVTP
jgi:hypothetical protein